MPDATACFQTHRPKTHARLRRRLTNETRGFPACSRRNARRHRHCHLPTRDRADLATRFADLERDVPGGGMRRLTRFARYLMPSVLVVWFGVAGRAVCCPRRRPTVHLRACAGDGRGSVFVPGAFSVSRSCTEIASRKPLRLLLSAMWTAPVAQVDVPIRADTVSDDYSELFVLRVPASGLNTASQRPAGFTDTLRREPISNRRDREVLRSRIRDLAPQHVCQEVPSDPPTTSTAIAANRDRASPPGEWPHLETVRHL